jgi:hypothetical protein
MRPFRRRGAAAAQPLVRTSEIVRRERGHERELAREHRGSDDLREAHRRVARTVGVGNDTQDPSASLCVLSDVPAADRTQRSVGDEDEA